MHLLVKDDVPPDPVDVLLLGPATVMTYTNRITHTVEEFRWRRHPAATREDRASLIPRQNETRTANRCRLCAREPIGSGRNCDRSSGVLHSAAERVWMTASRHRVRIRCIKHGAANPHSTPRRERAAVARHAVSKPR